MSLAKILLVVSAAVALIGCNPDGGRLITTQPGEDELLPGVPRRLMILPLDGDRRLSLMADKLLSDGLQRFGFTLISRTALDSARILSGADKDADIRRLVRDRWQVGAVVVGRIDYRVTYRARCFVNIEFVDALTGRSIWGAMVSDPRLISFSSDVEASANRTIRALLRGLERDLRL